MQSSASDSPVNKASFDPHSFTLKCKYQDERIQSALFEPEDDPFFAETENFRPTGRDLPHKLRKMLTVANMKNPRLKQRRQLNRMVST